MNEDPVFLEVVLLSDDFTLGGRDEIEDPLEEALRAAGVGEVTGGGTGMGVCNIDVEVTDPALGLQVIRAVLQGLGVARSTVINQYHPTKQVHLVYV